MDDQANNSPDTLDVDAIYEDGVIKPLAPLDLPSGTRVRLQINRRVKVAIKTSNTFSPANAVAKTSLTLRERWQQLASTISRFDAILLGIGILIYLLTRFIAIDRFPIYFFADEAVQTLNAQDLLANGLRDSTGTFLPPYFLNVDKWSLGLTVYVQLIGLALFGKSVVITRLMSALVSLLAVVAVSVMLRAGLRARLWWLGTLVLAVLPVWFLHSRTAFETVMMVAFYACFLCCYVLYRYHDPRWLLAAIMCGGATFYSYSNGQGVMLLTIPLLLVSDWRYHWSQRRNLKLLAWSAALVLMMLLPYLRFRWLHPEAVEQHLRTLRSYWIEPLPLSEKLSRFGEYYLWGISPNYWFLSNDTDLIRHRMGDMAHLRFEFLPFALIGLVICLRNWRSSAHRLVLVALLAAPFAAALVGIAATRALAIVIPATLLITLGIEQVFLWLKRWVSYRTFAVTCCVMISLLSLMMLRSALVNGPTWFTNYGMGGMQYGAQQLFTAVADDLDQHPERSLMVSPTWANGTDLLARFFLTPEQFARITLNSIESYTTRKTDIAPTMIFVLPPDEYATARRDPKFTLEAPERILMLPDGSPGFYFVHLAYSSQADALFAAEETERSKPVDEDITVNGQTIHVRHSVLDMGQPLDIFDGNPVTLMRGMEANPFLLELTFDGSRPLSEIAITTAQMDFRLRVTTISPDGTTHVVTNEYRDVPPDPREVIPLSDAPQQVHTLRLEITQLNILAGDIVNIHIRELELR